MLPFATRNRKVMISLDEGPTGPGPSSDALSTFKSAAFKLRRLRIPGKLKFLLFLICLLAVFLYAKIFGGLGQNSLTQEEFLEVQKCPACYGSSLCFEFFDNQIQFSGMSQYRVFDTLNMRNVHFAFHKYRDHDVVIKKLGFNKEIKEVDNWICKDSFRDPGCNIAQRFAVTQTAQDIKKNGLSPKHLKGTTFMFMCPSYRLVDRVIEKYVEKNRGDYISLDSQLQLLFTAKVNPETLLLQTFPSEEGWPFPRYYGAFGRYVMTFPSEEGWPFPRYYGACGRYVVVEHGGRPLAEFYNAPFAKRADLAYQMLVMAEKLTNDQDWALYWTDLDYYNFAADLAYQMLIMAEKLTNDQDWALYWTDLDYYNFAVDPSGKLSVIDLENIIVVDRKAVKLVNKKTWGDLAESTFDECKTDDEEYGNCLSFDYKDLCTHHMADLNYYAMCRNMLSKYANERDMPDGLLHDMPDIAKDDWDLDNLLNECARPRQPQGRIKVIPKLKEALKNLRNIREKGVKDSDNRIT